MRQLSRPINSFTAGKGLLRNENFQIAYATNDMDRAKAVMKERYGITQYQQMAGQMPTGGHIHVELAWVGATMYELVTAEGPGSEIFMSRLPDQEFVMQLHHLGFLIENEDEWQLLHQSAEAQGLEILSQNNNEGFMRHCFYEAPELGHYLEFVFPEPAGLAFLQQVPAN